MLSEEDRVGFGIITCPDLVPQVWDLAEAIPGALGELVEVASQRAALSSVRSERVLGGTC